ncbi:hypothetical protein Tco_0087938 [Tanacetum coccineum]
MTSPQLHNFVQPPFTGAEAGVWFLSNCRINASNHVFEFSTSDEMLAVEELPYPGCPFERKREKHKFNRRIWYVRNLHRRSDLVEITDVSMWSFFINSKKLLVLEQDSEDLCLILKGIRGDFGHNFIDPRTPGGCFEQLPP